MLPFPCYLRSYVSIPKNVDQFFPLSYLLKLYLHLVRVFEISIVHRVSKLNFFSPIYCSYLLPGASEAIASRGMVCRFIRDFVYNKKIIYEIAFWLRKERIKEELRKNGTWKKIEGQISYGLKYGPFTVK